MEWLDNIPVCTNEDAKASEEDIEPANYEEERKDELMAGWETDTDDAASDEEVAKILESMAPITAEEIMEKIDNILSEETEEEREDEEEEEGRDKLVEERTDSEDDEEEDIEDFEQQTSHGETVVVHKTRHYFNFSIPVSYFEVTAEAEIDNESERLSPEERRKRRQNRYKRKLSEQKSRAKEIGYIVGEIVKRARINQ